MDQRTRAYLRGRFGDHYRRTQLNLPPEPRRREWAYIPWSAGEGTTMVRHQSVADLGSISQFLARERPRHVYYSAGRYRNPGAGVMGAKGWIGSDLVFDLDADHLPGVDPATDSYPEMLDRCAEELECLLSLLLEDFGFNLSEMVFSGGRGFHVHVREPPVRGLSRKARREIVEYIRGDSVELESTLERVTVAGEGRETPASRRSLALEGGWGRRVHRALLELIDRLEAAGEEEATATLQQFEQIGQRRAAVLAETLQARRPALERGEIDVHPAVITLVAVLVEQTVQRQQAAIDDPVTTDLHRLIRLPGSLHGGTGLSVQSLSGESLEAFDPTSDPIPNTFRGQSITIELEEATTVTLDGERYQLEAGNNRVPEFVGIFLMADGRAEKGKEPAGRAT